jgi:excisionase family DNA binding protein
MCLFGAPVISNSLRAMIDSATPGELPSLAAEFAMALASVYARIAATHTTSMQRMSAAEDDGMLTVKQAAERLGVAPSWLYRHSKKLPFARKLGHRTLRFDARALNRWFKTRVTE